MSNFSLTQSQADFVAALVRKFGADAALAPKEILDFAVAEKVKRPNWFFTLGTRTAYARYTLPTDVTVVEKTRKARVAKTPKATEPAKAKVAKAVKKTAAGVKPAAAPGKMLTTDEVKARLAARK